MRDNILDHINIINPNSILNSYNSTKPPNNPRQKRIKAPLSMVHKQPISTRKNNQHHYSPGKCKNERLLNTSWDDYDFKRKIACADKGVGEVGVVCALLVEMQNK